MKKEVLWRNSSIQMAVLAGLAAAVAAYLILTAGVFTKGKTTNIEKNVLSARNGQRQSQGLATGSQVRNETRMLTALRISDYEILRPRLRKGIRVNIICGYGENQNMGPQEKTILENVLVAEVPLSSGSRLSSREQGILIETTKEESERLASIASAEPLRIVIKED